MICKKKEDAPGSLHGRDDDPEPGQLPFRTGCSLSFGKKITAIFLVVVILQGFLIGFVSLRYAADLVLNNKKGDIADLVNRIDITINTNVRYTSWQLEGAAGNRILSQYLRDGDAASTAAVEEYMDYMRKTCSAATNVLLCSRDTVLCDLDGSAPSFPGSLPRLYDRAAANQGKAVFLGLVPPVHGARDAKPVISAACAVQNPATHEMEGVLLLELDPQTFSNLLLNNQNTYTNQYTFIVDRQGTLISSNKSMEGRWVRQVDRDFAAGKRRFSMTWGGREYYVCGQSNGLTGWVSYSLIAMDSILEQLRGLRALILLFVVLCTCVASAFLFFVTYALVAPLKQLSAAMANVHRGDFSEQLQTRRRDEMGQLIHSYNFMLRRIKELIGEVYQEKLAQKDAELEALQLQINPHFLYNTLDSINWMAIDAGDLPVSKAIIDLGNLMEYSLYSQSSFATLHEELCYVGSYLRLQKNRLENRLRYEISCCAGAESRLVPRLILQPIVENAITHGLEPTPNGGVLTIDIREDAAELVIVVRDNGAGMEQSQVTALLSGQTAGQQGHTCIGVRNVDKRLRLHYGEGYRLGIESAPGSGTAVTLRIPQTEPTPETARML
ncbi:MAG: sensor histidine kinase [Oscillospiraceae bacterium]